MCDGVEDYRNIDVFIYTSEWSTFNSVSILPYDNRNLSWLSENGDGMFAGRDETEWRKDAPPRNVRTSALLISKVTQV